MEDDFRFAIPGQIAPSRRLVVDDIKNFVTNPMFGAISGPFTFRVLVPRSVLARKPVNDDVIPSVSVDVGSEREEIVRVCIVLAQSTFETGNLFLRAIGFGASERFFRGI